MRLVRLLGSTAVATMAVLVSPASAATFVYATNHTNPGSVTQFGSVAQGQLFALSPASVLAGNTPETPGASPDGRSLYVPNRNGNSISQYDISQTTGKLSPKSPASISGAGGPVDITVSPDGLSAYATDYDNALVREYNVSPTDGTLSVKATPSIAAGPNPARVAVSPTGTCAYASSYGDGSVWAYTVGAGGALVPAATPSVSRGGNNAAGLAVSPDSAYLYVANTGGIVYQYTIAPATCVLTYRTDFATVGSSSYELALRRNVGATNLYVTNLGSNTVTQFTRNVTTGDLSGQNLIATGAFPTGLALSADGTSLYTANLNSNSISQFTIAANGVLSAKPVPTVAVNAPWGLAAADISTIATAVGWRSGSARRVGGVNVVRWAIGHVDDVAAFDVLRVRHHRRMAVNARPIDGPAVGGGERYRFVDRAGRRGDRYLVRAQLVDGSTADHGPYAVRR